MRAFLRQVGDGLGEAVVAVGVAVVVGVVGLYAFSTVQWPAFGSSNVTRALTTVGQVGAAGFVVGAIVVARVRGWGWWAKGLAWVGVSGFVTVTLGMPLAATKLYLLGISVDQEFRTEYLTRLTDTAAPRDMTYADLPPFYPAGWFWIGGRVANLLGLAGWAAFKPYAIVSLAVAAVLATVLWSKLIRPDLAVAVGAATTAVMVAFASPEAYSAVLVVLFAPSMALAWGALYRPAEWGAGERTGAATARGWGAVVGAGVFVGVSGMFYTLFFAVAAFTVGVMAVVAWCALLWQRRSDAIHRRPAEDAPGPWRLLGPILVRLIVIGAIAGVLTLITWGPYLLRMASGPRPSGGTALHYLPESGARLAFPMFDFTHPLLGALCLLGTIWLVLRLASSRRAQALAVSVAAIYLWSLGSMAVTAGGTTLLAFRLEPILQVLLAAAGTFGFAEGARALYQAVGEPARLRAAAAAVAVVGALAFTQDIPAVLATEITTAYTDTDGDGVRADKRAPSAVTHYRAIDEALRTQTGRPRDETVVLTADTSFLSYYPYYGFQALTSHYANPLADFAGRAAAIKRWSELKTPAELIDALNHCPWRAPDAFVFRRSGDEYTLRLSEDVYPNDPNVRRYTVAFPKALFDDPHFRTTDIGPFTLVVRA
ncbi:arabinofuranosyltransferase [Nocardia sp. NPDC003482]